MPNNISQNSIIKYRMIIINNILELLISEGMIETLVEPLKKTMSISIDKINILRKPLIKEITDDICHNIFSAQFNEKFIKNKIRPFIEKIFEIETLEDLIIFSENVEKNLTINYFFTNEDMLL